MKNAAECTRRIKQFFSMLKKAGGKGALAEFEDPLEMLLLSILSNSASESRAAAAVEKLREAMVDYNDLRVTPAAQIIEIIGPDFPSCRSAARAVSSVLTAIFNRLHHMSLDFLKTGSRKSAESFLNSLDDLPMYAKAMMSWRCLGNHIVPLDAAMFAYLQRNNCIAPDATVDDAQRFVASVIKERDLEDFYTRFKRFAASHAPRKMVGAKPIAEPEAKQQPQPAQASAEGTRAAATGSVAAAKPSQTKAARLKPAAKPAKTSASRGASERRP